VTPTSLTEGDDGDEQDEQIKVEEEEDDEEPLVTITRSTKRKGQSQQSSPVAISSSQKMHRFFVSVEIPETQGDLADIIYQSHQIPILRSPAHLYLPPCHLLPSSDSGLNRYPSLADPSWLPRRQGVRTT